MKKRLTTVLLVLVLLVGIAILLYPTVSDYWNSFHQSRAIANYAEQVTGLDKAVYEELWNAAVDFNKRVAERNNLVLPESDLEEYLSLLNISGNGVMGYIEIPSIGCSLPIYHGTDESVLQIAVGHLDGSSLPVGGASTHSVLSAHRGLPSAKLFTHLDRLVEGDIFMMQILNETLSYEVDQIRIVLPNEVNDLAISSGQDYCTLTTCTPYGVNTHRLLVRGHRVANQPEAKSIRVTADAMRIEPIIVIPAVAVPMLLLLMLLTLFGGGKKTPKASAKAQKKSDPEKKGGNHDEE